MYIRTFLFHSGIHPGETFYDFSFSAKDVPGGWAVCLSNSLSDPRALRSKMHLHPSS